MPDRTSSDVPHLHSDIRRALYRRAPGYVRWRLEYGTFVSFEHRLMYMETPKNACSTTKIIFWKLIGLPEDGLTPARVHERRQYDGRTSVMDLEPNTARRILRGDHYYRFCFLRDPERRLASAYKNKILDLKQANYQPIRQAIISRNELDGVEGITFDMFAEYACAQPNKERDPHWQEQAGLNLLDQIDYHFIGRVENYSEDMAHVLRVINAPAHLLDSTKVVHNATHQEPMSASPAVAALVREAYAADYAALERRVVNPHANAG